MKPEDDKLLHAIDATVDEVLSDKDEAANLKKALHDRLETEPTTGKKAQVSGEDAQSDDSDLFDNMPI